MAKAKQRRQKAPQVAQPASANKQKQKEEEEEEVEVEVVAPRRKHKKHLKAKAKGVWKTLFGKEYRKAQVLFFVLTAVTLLSLGRMRLLPDWMMITQKIMIDGESVDEKLEHLLDEVKIYREALPHLLRLPQNWTRDLDSVLGLLSNTEEMPGTLSLREGRSPRMPVVLLPGIVSTKLEVWKGEECARPFFRECFWGSRVMLQNLLLNRDCWLRHIALDMETGLDPEGIKLRPAQGMGAADYIVGDYWVWGKLIRNLAEVGYDPSSMFMASYDWRLSMTDLQSRDKFFTHLQRQIESLVTDCPTGHCEKVAVVAHSMGTVVWMYFMQWVEHQQRTTGAEGSWTEKYIGSFINIGGPTLGVPKALSAVLSGEMRDTVELNSVSRYIKENFVSRSDLLKLFRSFRAVASMLPKGGEAIWGNTTTAPEDDQSLAIGSKHGSMITFSDYESMWTVFGSDTGTEKIIFEDNDVEFGEIDVQLLDSCSEDSGASFTPLDSRVLKQWTDKKKLSIIESLDMLRVLAPNYTSAIDGLYSFGMARSHEEMMRLRDDPKYWTNPLESQLPNAPGMKVFCLYGVSKETERAYIYRENEKKCNEIPLLINNHASVPPSIRNGVTMGDGDGTVPLMSLGFMCTRGWSHPLYNPGGVNVTTREYAHEGGMLPTRSASAADHVDIMGNSEMLTDIINIITGHSHLVAPRIHSNITVFASRVDLPPVA